MRSQIIRFAVSIVLVVSIGWLGNAAEAQSGAPGNTSVETPANRAGLATPEILSAEYVSQKVAAVSTLVDKLIEFGVQYGFQILGALLILVAGYLLSRWTMRLVVSILEKRNIDITTRTFIGKATRTIVLLIAVVIALGNSGVSIAPMIAAIGAITFGATLALQGPISNYGAGLCIILTHPFRVGNTIEIQGVSGVVEEIRLAHTVLSTEDGEQITIPNQQIIGKIITNSFACKICTTSIGISYADDPHRAIEVIEAALARIQEVSTESKPQVGIFAFGDSAINLHVRFWVPTRHYFAVVHRANLELYRALRQAGISIPFPQREVRMLRSGEPAAEGRCVSSRSYPKGLPSRACPGTRCPAALLQRSTSPRQRSSTPISVAHCSI